MDKNYIPWSSSRRRRHSYYKREVKSKTSAGLLYPKESKNPSIILRFQRILQKLHQKLLKYRQAFYSLFEQVEKHEQTFQHLKKLFISSTDFALSDFNKDFHLYTDASGISLGAALIQLDDKNKLQVIACSSRVLSKTEKKYLATQKGSGSSLEFTVILFMSNLTALLLQNYLNSKILIGKLAWQSFIIKDFNKSLTFVPGKANMYSSLRIFS